MLMTLDPHLEREARTDPAARRELARRLTRSNDVRGAMLTLTLETTTSRQWSELLRLIDAAPEDEQPALVEWIEPWLARWSSLMRKAPDELVERAIGGLEPPPWARLCEALVLTQTSMSPRDFATLMARPPWQQLTSLYIRGQRRLGNSAVDTLVNHGVLESLTHLEISGSSLTSRRVARLVGTPQTAGLVWLDLHGNEFGTEALAEVLRSPYLAKLRSLSLSGCRLREDSADALRDTCRATALRRLDLSYNSIGSDAVDALASHATLRRLDTLSLRTNALDDEAAHALACATSLPRLAELNLRNNRVGRTGLMSLLDSTSLPALTRLHLDDNDIRDARRRPQPLLRRVAALWDSLTRRGSSDEGVEPDVDDGLPGLHTLTLSKNRLGDEVVTALAGCDALRKLVVLDLSSNQVGASGVRALGRGRMRRLRKLMLRGHVLFGRDNRIGDDGAIALTELPAFKGLVELDLYGTGLSDRGALALAHTEGLQQLRRLEVTGRDLSEATRKALKGRSERHPDLRVRL